MGWLLSRVVTILWTPPKNYRYHLPTPVTSASTVDRIGSARFRLSHGITNLSIQRAENISVYSVFISRRLSKWGNEVLFRVIWKFEIPYLTTKARPFAVKIVNTSTCKNKGIKRARKKSNVLTGSHRIKKKKKRRGSHGFCLPISGRFFMPATKNGNRQPETQSLDIGDQKPNTSKNQLAMQDCLQLPLPQKKIGFIYKNNNSKENHCTNWAPPTGDSSMMSDYLFTSSSVSKF